MVDHIAVVRSWLVERLKVRNAAQDSQVDRVPIIALGIRCLLFVECMVSFSMFLKEVRLFVEDRPSFGC